MTKSCDSLKHCVNSRTRCIHTLSSLVIPQCIKAIINFGSKVIIPITIGITPFSANTIRSTNYRCQQKSYKIPSPVDTKRITSSSELQESNQNSAMDVDMDVNELTAKLAAMQTAYNELEQTRNAERNAQAEERRAERSAQAEERKAAAKERASVRDHMERQSAQTNQALTVAVNAASTTVSARARYPDTELFDASNITAYRSFVANLQTKLRYDSSCFVNDAERIAYAFGRLRGEASNRILPWFTLHGETATYREFQEQMDTTFKDEDSERKAMKTISNIKQGSQDLKEFLVKFDLLLNEAGARSLPDQILIGFLEAALSDKIHSGLIGSADATTYAGFCTLIRSIDDRQKRRLERNGVRNLNLAYNHLAPKTKGTDAMDWEPTPRVSSVQAGKGGRKRARWASEEEMKKRREKGNCLRCGGSGHYAHKCRLLPPERPVTVGNIREEADESTDDGNQSEN